MSNIWIVSEHYYPCGNTTSYLITRISEGLAGYAPVNVITTTAHGSAEEMINGVKIYRTRDSFLDKNKFSQRIFKLLLLSFRLIWKSARLIKRNDVVLVVTNPAPIIFLMGILKKFKGFRLCFLAHDLFPENLVIAGVVKNTNPIYKTTLRLFNYAYRRADRIIVIGRDMEKTMKGKIRGSDAIIRYIPNFADVDFIRPMPKETNEMANKLGLTGKFVILFTGNIGRAQDIENILKAMKLLKEQPHIHLLMIGEGAKFKTARDLIKKYNLENVTLLDSIDRTWSNDFLNAGDAGLVSLQPGRKGIGIPSKTYTYLAAGKPIIGVVDRDSEVEMLIRETNCGWWIEPGDPQKTAELFRKISESDEVKSRAAIARSVAESGYSIQSTIPLFHDLIKEVSYEGRKQSLVQG